jgi:uncharacterized CHY-type Zn-finger protein
MNTNTPDNLPRERMIAGMPVKGKVIDDQTRCSHYHTHLDIIAIKFKCCDTYYPCYSCHQEDTDHAAVTWSLQERDTKAILCGACGHELTITEYLSSQNTCPSCHASFNPNCEKHYGLYFEGNYIS